MIQKSIHAPISANDAEVEGKLRTILLERRRLWRTDFDSQIRHHVEHLYSPPRSRTCRKSNIGIVMAATVAISFPEEQPTLANSRSEDRIDLAQRVIMNVHDGSSSTPSTTGAQKLPVARTRLLN